MNEPCTSENCHAWRTYGFAHTHPQDTAAGPRALISRLQQLNDDGTPAPPTQEDGPAVAEQDHTSGLAVNLCLLPGTHAEHDWWYTSSGGGHMLTGPDPSERNVTQHHCPGRLSVTGRFPRDPVMQRVPLPNYMQQSEVGNAYWVALQAELEELEREDPSIAKVSQRLQEQLERLTENIHQVYVSNKALRCTLSCSGPAPHLDEYRAADVRPPAEQTARNNATDANKLPSSNKN